MQHVRQKTWVSFHVGIFWVCDITDTQREMYLTDTQREMYIYIYIYSIFYIERDLKSL